MQPRINSPGCGLGRRAQQKKRARAWHLGGAMGSRGEARRELGLSVNLKRIANILPELLLANPQKTVLFLLGVCYRTEEVPSFLRHREYVHCIAYTSQCAFCYCCAYQPSPSNDCTQQSLLSNDCAQQHMLCIDMLLVPLPLPSLALHTTCAATTARANTCFALTYCL